MIAPVRWVLTPWEEIYVRLAGARPIPGGSGAGRWAVRRYAGPRLVLTDGQEVAPGSTVIELHLVNARMRDLTAKDASPSLLITLRAECKALARAAQHGDVPDFAALTGTTLLTPLVRRLGFDVKPAPASVGNRMIGAWQRVLRATFHPTGHFRQRGQLYVLWMSRQRLLDHYGQVAP